jgi:hypothetical protein
MSGLDRRTPDLLTEEIAIVEAIRRAYESPLEASTRPTSSTSRAGSAAANQTAFMVLTPEK